MTESRPAGGGMRAASVGPSCGPWPAQALGGTPHPAGGAAQVARAHAILPGLIGDRFGRERVI
ncbi:hypothetical protein [Methylorubrum aminovorans]